MDGRLAMEANPGKQLEIRVREQVYLRIPVRTKVISATDDIVDVAREYVAPWCSPVMWWW